MRLAERPPYADAAGFGPISRLPPADRRGLFRYRALNRPPSKKAHGHRPVGPPMSRVPTPISNTADRGQAVYTPLTLRLYDGLVHGFTNRYLWKCPTTKLLGLYDRYVSANHLDVGVGTGYFLDRCTFPSEGPRLVLCDLNEHCLEATAKRVARYAPQTRHANVLEPIAYDGQPFDSIGLMYLLHCLPGSIEEKAVCLDHLAPLLAPEGVLFGATLLGRGIRRNLPARALMAAYNRKGIFSNTRDDEAGLRAALKSQFDEVTIELAGCGALFVARGMK